MKQDILDLGLVVGAAMLLVAGALASSVFDDQARAAADWSLAACLLIIEHGRASK